MYSFISPNNEVIKTNTVKAFAKQYGFNYSSARNLACGHQKTMLGWCSTNKRAKRVRTRFQTVLVNTKTGERKILGQSLTQFARDNHLCMNELWKLLNGRKIMYRGWTLEKSVMAAAGVLGGRNI
jgi:hypothetical protein